MAIIGIYKITSPSNRIYIGQSVNIQNRFWRYNEGKCYKQIRLYNSFVKYGVKNHKFEIIELCEKSQLNELERYYQDLYNVTSAKGLNVRLQGTKDKSGEMSAITKRKLSIANSGKKRTEEMNIAMRESKQGSNIAGSMLLDTTTGIYYKSIVEASFSYPYKSYGTLRAYLNGELPNKTNLINV